MDEVKIRRLIDNDEDYKLLTKWYQEEEIYHAFEQRALSYDEIKSKYFPRTLNDTKIPVYMIEYNGNPVGIIQYKKLDTSEQELHQLYGDNIFELDIFIGELKEHNKGIASRAINMFCNMLYQTKVINKIIMCPLADNNRAINCYKKCGFKEVRMYQSTDTIGQPQTYILMIKE